ncbi:wings apart-like protein regulation of heterochromatin-domain-containing protein [Aspergillus coremiiformis]|uniref:Wings apart-like protein regulation of heterochromatin-domain-containing protein n=1 Tax=Aspergillus coremiiformis TaxID=138285 RepID=A0A5N6YSE9_9EURO|nr:wings apart-like protein regulation of heterochromatin-domain-containing protein [Aspergillus coremiiformis]
MRGKSRRLVTYGKATSDKSQNPKNSGQEISTAHALSSESGSAKAYHCSSPVTQSLQLSEHDCQHYCDVGLRSTSPVDHHDTHVPDPQSSQGKAYDVTGKKRRKLFHGRQTQKHSVGAITPPMTAREHHARLGEATACITANEVPHLTKAVDQTDSCSLPKSTQTGPGTPGPTPGTITYKLRSHRDRNLSSETAGLPMSHLSDVNTIRHHKELPTIRKRLVDSLNATEELTRTRPLNHLSDHECQSDCHPLSSPIRGEKDRQLTAGMQQHKPLGTDNAQQTTTPKPSRPARPRITYAHQRSFLDDAAMMAHIETSGLSLSSGDCNLMHPQLNPGFLSSHVEDQENLDHRPIRSIHELRQAGDNARFRETVDLIFEDIEDPRNSVSEVCNGFVQLCTKLMEPQFSHRFSECGFDERLVKCMTGSFDIISITLALCAFKLIRANGSFPPTLLLPFWYKILDISSTLLAVEDDILLTMKQRSFGLSKAVQASLKGLLPRLSLAAYGEPISTISPRLLMLLTIRSSLLMFQEQGSSVDIPSPLLSLVVGFSSTESCENLAFHLPPERFHTLIAALSIVETYTVLSGPLDAEHCDSLRPLIQCHNFLHPNPSGQSRQIQVLYIRVLLNLTNKEASLCEECCRSELVGGLVSIIISEFCALSQESTTKENGSLDTVILALGALINLAEKSESSRSIFLTSTDNSASFLHLLICQFRANISSVSQAHSVPEVKHNVAVGYLSILLVTLCLNQEALTQVKASLDGTGLASALSTAEEFLQYHQRVEKDSRLFETRDEDGCEPTSRLEQILCQIRQHHAWGQNEQSL